MPRDVATEQATVEVCRYLRRWAHTSFVEREIQSRHAGLAHDLRVRKARDAAASVIQSIELLESARSSSLLTKPLPLFYAAEAIAKAVAIVADPTLEGSSFRAHGLQGIKRRRYFVRTLSCRVMNPGSDVWSKLCSSSNSDLVRLDYTRDGESVISDRLNSHAANPVPPNAELVLGELLRQVPEVAEDLVDAGIQHPFVVHVPHWQMMVNSAAETVEVRCTLRHAHAQATRQMIVDHESGRGDLRQFNRTNDVLDVVEYHARPQKGLHGPETRSDVFGRLYMNFVRTRAYLGELPVFYAALFILSDAVRYQGQWQKLLEDHPEEEVLVDRFLDVALRKLPNLALNHLTGTFHLFVPAHAT